MMHAMMGRGRRVGAALGVVWCLLLGAPAPAGAAAPGGGPAFEALPREVLHEVERGQDLHLIAGYYYGDARQWERIWQANRDVLRNPNRLAPGAVLRVPVDRDWKQDLPYADWIRSGGAARAGAPGGTAAPSTSPAAPAAAPAGRRAAAPAASPAPASPAGEPLPAPSGPVSLRYKPAKGFTQTLRLNISGTILQEARGSVRTVELAATGRIRQVVEDVAGDGAVRETMTLLEGRATNFSFADQGIPEVGETLRQTVSPLSRVLRVEGKEPGTPYYTKAIAYPEAPVALGGSWKYEDRLRTAAGNLVQTTQCTLVRRERFRGEEAYRLQCQLTVVAAPGEKAQYSVTGAATALIRARDGTPMYAESKGKSSGEVPEQNVKVSGETRGVIEEEAPAPASAGR